MSGGFESMGLCGEILGAIDAMGYTLPTEIQDEAIPLILGGGDVMAAAPTGSGKTAAFALPILELVQEKLREKGDDDEEEESSTPALSANDRDAMMAVDGVRCQCRSERWAGIRGTVGAVRGKVYYEVEIEDQGLARVGWSEAEASLDLGTDARGWGYGGTGKKSNARNFETYGEPYGEKDVIGCLLDADTGEIRFSKNGRILSNNEPAFRLGRERDGHQQKQAQTRTPLAPTVSLKNAQVKVSFDDLKYLPKGYGKLEDGVLMRKKKTKRQRRGRSCSAVVLEPARDLAEQTYDNFVKYAQNLPHIECRLLIGGVDCRKAERDCESGSVDVIVATPRKLKDSIKRDKIDVSEARFFVLDEADRFADDKEDKEAVEAIFNSLGTTKRSGSKRLQVAFFSATLHSDPVKSLSAKFCLEPTWVDLKGASQKLPDAVKHVVLQIDPKDPYLKRLVASSSAGGRAEYVTDAVHRKGKIDAETPSDLHGKDAESEFIKQAKPLLIAQLIDQLDMDQVLIFCRTNLDCDHLEKYLVKKSGKQTSLLKKGVFQKKETGVESRFSCAVLAGGRDMRQRRAALDAFKSGDVRVLICTDVAARGIDVAGLPYVLNATLPDSDAQYVHRTGRVGRADKIGLALSLVATCQERVWYCQKGKKPPQSDVRDYAAGGNCVWYDEPHLFRALETKLAASDASFVHLKPSDDIALPKDLQALNFGSAAGCSDDGGGGPSPSDGGSSAHVLKLAPDVEQLKALELQAQRAYFALLQTKPLVGGGGGAFNNPISSSSS